MEKTELSTERGEFLLFELGQLGFSGRPAAVQAACAALGAAYPGSAWRAAAFKEQHEHVG